MLDCCCDPVPDALLFDGEAREELELPLLLLSFPGLDREPTSSHFFLLPEAQSWDKPSSNMDVAPSVNVANTSS
jgi:hypothetical protein